jgi:hypothetical protein
MKSSWLFLAGPVLLGSTALVQAADPQGYPVYVSDDTHTIFALTATAGGVIMDLPDGGGLFEGEGAVDGNDLLYGGTVGLSASLTAGKIGDLMGFVGLNLFGTYAAGSFNKTSAFTGNGVVVMQGGGGPNQGSINITTSSPNANAIMSVGNVSPQSEIVSASAEASTGGAGPGAADAAVVSVGDHDRSFVWGGVQRQADGPGNRATAYAAIADTNGGVFVAAGDLSGLVLNQNYSTEAFYAGGEVTFGVSGQHGTTALQAYVGPSYRYLAQRNKMHSNMTVDVPEYTNAGLGFPHFSMSSSDELSSHYLGGVAGLMATIATSQTTAITIGIEGGAYYTLASLDSRGTYRAWGGEVSDNLPEPGNVPFGDITVSSEGETYEANTIAFAARGTAAYTMAIAPQAQLTFAGTVDYLSAVAHHAVNATVVTGNGTTNVDYQSGGLNDRVAWGHMLNLSGTVSLTGQF